MVRQAILLAVAVTAAALASASPIRIGTWNIRVGDDKEPSWPSRKADWTAQFESLRIDAGGLQEVSPVQMAFLREKFPQYEIVGDHREKDRVTGEASPFFWLKNRYEAEKTGTFWLSPTPDVPGSKGWDAACRRVCSYAVLRDRVSGVRLCIASCHADHMGRKARLHGLQLAVKRLHEIAGGIPIVFMGDHNCRETDPAAMELSKILDNALYVSETPPQGPWRTMTRFEYWPPERETLCADALKLTLSERNELSGNPDEIKAKTGVSPKEKHGARIDYIYVSHGVRVLDVTTDGRTRLGKREYASDHFPVVATIDVDAWARVAFQPTGFMHEMPKATNEMPLDTPYPQLAETFADPFGKIQTGCYWYWLSGHISPEGAVKDLEAMKRVGIDRPYIGDVGGPALTNERGPVKTLSPKWKETMQTAFATAAKLDMDIGVFNAPGWGMSGGPWVENEESMRRFVSSSVVVEGPKKGVKLPKPKFECVSSKEYRDLFAIAYPVGEDFDRRLEKTQSNDELTSKAGEPIVVELTSYGDFRAQSAEAMLKGGVIAGRLIVEVPYGDSWRKVCDAEFSRVNYGVGVGFSPRAPIIASFAPVTARKFRVTVKPTHTDIKKDGRDAPSFKSIAVCAAPLVEQAFEKSLAKMFESPLPMWTYYKWPQEEECVNGTALDPSKAVVLRSKVAEDGTLDWNVPTGKWTIYRFGVAPTGTKNGPAYDDASGREVDKMSREHVARHFDSYLGKLLAETPKENRKVIRHAILDSYEVGGQNFTDGFAEKFKASFGYDPTPYLPALFGMAVSNRADSDRFLWDLRRFVADEVAYSFAGGLRKASNAHGLETWLENYGHWGYPGEFLQYGGQSDEVAGEYWSEGDLGNIENRAASSCAHIYGKRLVWAESNTAGFKHYQRGPMDMKLRTDRFFAEGLNATILHFYAHQPDERQPGMLEVFGNEFNRHNTWFDHMDLFTGYLKRCGWMLRQGLNVADVAYFIGEDVPCMTGVCDPALPPGRQFDYINAEVLIETAAVDAKGRIVLPHGTAYEVLVLPNLETMRPKMIECIERLVNAGALVIGPKPKRSPSLAGQPQSDAKVREIAERLWDGGKISASMTLEEALAKRKSEPDVVFDARSTLAYAHRTMPNAEIYFVSNQSGEEIPAVDVSFRVNGRAPELWDAATGKSCAAGKWRVDGNRTAVTLSLAKHESVFVVFPVKEGNGEWETGNGFNPVKSSIIPGPWTVSFESDSLHRGPKEPIMLDKLIDLSTSSDPAIKYYSGKIVYRTKFTIGERLSRATLDMGNVGVTAKVKVNGKYAGGVCFAPYRLDIAPFVKEGENELEIEVCNLWINRLVGDADMNDAPTWTSIKHWDAKTKLPASGLLGPVRIVSEGKGIPCLKSMDAGLIAVDAVGRKMPESVERHANRLGGRQVGMFYFLCLGEHGKCGGPYDVSKILAADPQAMHKPESTLWGPWDETHHWGEPFYGYYFSRDEWVVRRHMRLLMQAGIDFLFFDVSNDFTYDRCSMTIMRVLQEYHDAGWKIPKVVFYTNPDDHRSAKTVRHLYNKIYKPGYCPDTWFMLEGRPLVIGREAACPEEAKGFFSYRETQWPTQPIRENAWPWIDFKRPQHIFVNKRGEPESVSVSVAQHPRLRMGDSAMYGEKGNWGRAFHGGKNDTSPDAWKMGGNFREQFEYAISNDVPVVMVTGWNEWTMGRGRRGADAPDRPIQFVDCANGEYSRDLEMMRGGYFDNYYMQLCSLVRRYKGASAPTAHKPGEGAVYFNIPDGDFHRDAPGYGGVRYKNATGRNAISRIEVLHDAETVTFRIAAKNPIDPAKRKEGTWMRIYVNTSGSQGCDFIVNNHAHSDGTTSVARVKSHGEGLAAKDIPGASATWKIEDGILTVCCPRKALGVDGKDFELWFKVADSKSKLRNIEDFYDHGDAAPLGRLNYVYKGVDDETQK